MKNKKIRILLFLFFFPLIVLYPFKVDNHFANSEILYYVVNPKTQDLKFFWKDDKGNILKSILNLKNYVESNNMSLIFAMNGGMYKKDSTPLGLFIKNKEKLSSINTAEGNGNFYMKPNGIFYITKEKSPIICKTSEFIYSENIEFATQSGPMLLINGEIHPSFKKGSSNLNIRNGVGILPDNNILFAMSKTEINFYDFASYFADLGCVNALYLDGFVSRCYLPEKNWIQTDGAFGVLIGVVKQNK